MIEGPAKRRKFSEYKKLSFVQRYMRLSRGTRAVLGLLLGTYALVGLYSYEEMNTSQPPEGMDERVVAISIMPMESKQEKRFKEERLQQKLQEANPQAFPDPKENESEKVYI